jgi:predicted  nucleic acid-binding Zn-ribbon protein
MNFFSTASKSISQAGEKAARSTKEFSDIFTPNDDKLRRIIEKDEPARLSGILWKRRGGFGAKLGSYSGAWERRYMELRGNVLLYYETAGEETNKTLTGTERSVSSSPKEPRGYLDLSEDKAAAQATYGHSGAPSPFCISIRVGIAQETRWKLCFDHHQTQMEWLVGISDASIRCSVDDYNQALLKAANPNSQEKTLQKTLLPRAPPVYEPGTGGKKVHTLWSLEEYTVTNSTHKNVEESKASSETTASSTASKDTAPLDNALQVMETLLAQKEKARIALEQTATSLKTQVGSLEKSILKIETQLTGISAEKQSQKETIASLTKSIEEKERKTKEASEETRSIQNLIAPLKQELKEKDTKIKALEEELEKLRLEMEGKVKTLEDEKSRTEEKQHKLLWALKEEFRTSLEAQRKEYVEEKATTQVGPANESNGDDDEFEDCVG